MLRYIYYLKNPSNSVSTTRWDFTCKEGYFIIEPSYFQEPLTDEKIENFIKNSDAMLINLLDMNEIPELWKKQIDIAMENGIDIFLIVNQKTDNGSKKYWKIATEVHGSLAEALQALCSYLEASDEIMIGKKYEEEEEIGLTD